MCRQLKVQECCQWLFPRHCQPEAASQLRKSPLMGLGMVEDSTGHACRCCLTSDYLEKCSCAIASQQAQQSQPLVGSGIGDGRGAWAWTCCGTYLSTSVSHEPCAKSRAALLAAALCPRRVFGALHKKTGSFAPCSSILATSVHVS